MDRFRSDRRGGFGGSRSGGRSFGGRSGGRDRSFGRSDSGPREMHDATCSKCGKPCQVPFKPTGSKPVLCSDCFRDSDSGNSRGRDRSAGSGISSEQFNQLNAKLDKILLVLADLELDTGDEDSEDEDSEDEDSEEIEDKM